MPSLQNIFRTKIWTRLFLMIVTAILLTWGVVALALFLLTTAREVVNDVIRDDVPRVIDTARLSATTADLGLLSNRLLRANEANLDAVEEELRNAVARYKSSSIRTFLLTSSHSCCRCWRLILTQSSCV